MIYVKTELGRLALKERAEAMPRKFHFPFMMCDGLREHSDILQAGLSTGFLQSDLDQMVALGFIQLAPSKAPKIEAARPVEAPSGVTQSQAKLPSQHDANVFLEASSLATALSSQLGLRGFRLNMAVQSASNLSDLQALVPQLEKILGVKPVKPLADLLTTSGR